MTVPTRTRLRGAAVTMLAAVELATTGCASGGAGRGDDVTGEDTRDAAGKTQAQVANLSLKDEFDSAGERYERDQGELLLLPRRPHHRTRRRDRRGAEPRTDAALLR